MCLSLHLLHARHTPFYVSLFLPVTTTCTICITLRGMSYISCYSIFTSELIPSLSLPYSPAAAYEPPPDILFVLPVDRKVLTSRTRKVYSSEHGLKLRVSNDYWSGDNKSHGLHVCLGAAMHYSQTFPQVLLCRYS